MAFGFVKGVFLVLIPCLLLLVSLGTYRYSQLHQLYDEEDLQLPPLPYDQYTLTKTHAWSQRFDFQEEQHYNEAPLEIGRVSGNVLEINKDGHILQIEYEYEVDVDLIQEVAEVAEQDDKTVYPGWYVLVKYHKFVEVAYFDLKTTSS